MTPRHHMQDLLSEDRDLTDNARGREGATHWVTSKE